MHVLLNCVARTKKTGVLPKSNTRESISQNNVILKTEHKSRVITKEW